MGRPIDETRLPKNGGEPDETHLPGGAIDQTHLPGANAAHETALLPGQTVGRSYVVVRPMQTPGAQATLYMARRQGRVYAVKLYDAGYRPNEALLKELRRGACPYVAELLDYGVEQARFYEVYRYYEQGTLNDRPKWSAAFVSDVVVPCVNEGLRYLHTVGGTGVVHGDIKPDNLFLSDDEARVIIGDFGVSSAMDARGVLIDDMCGTPEYSPPTLGFYGKMQKTAAFDYCSLGLVLIRLLTGHSLFEDMQRDAIARLWSEGISVPTSIDVRLRTLINGLIQVDEAARFGYQDVKSWCEGAYIKEKRRVFDFADEVAPVSRTYFFGVFDNRPLTVETREELFDAMAGHWAHARRLLERESFLLFLGTLDGTLTSQARALSHEPDRDAAVFKLLYLIDPQPRLVYRGSDYGNARAFVDGLMDEQDLQRREVVEKGLFLYFLTKTEEDADLIEAVRRMHTLAPHDGGFVPKLLYYAFHRERVFAYQGKRISNIGELIALVLTLENDALEQLATDRTFLAWLTSLGYGEQVRKLLREEST